MRPTLPIGTEAGPVRGPGTRLQAGHGFTLVEILVVLVLVGLLSAMLVPMLLPSSGRTLERSAAEVNLALRETRRQARAQRQSLNFTVDTGDKGYRTGGSAPWQALPDDMTIELTTAESLLSSTTRGAIAFHPDGSSSGGRIVLGLAGQARQIDIEWLTGRIRVTEVKP
ncbi:MAG: prepilin-type N-terminal cleavage/methylation domain-containing protein [Gammaproteobacteria bacterium]|nr:prepilin-type N-terminal cleavage/methylation domain-containing protein [Gammaproteobacteria bacterium]